MLILLGFNVTFFPQFILGTRGMPRRYYNMLPEFQPLHQLSTIGAYIIAIGFILTLFYLLHSLFWGKPAPANPWGAATLEWQIASPPTKHNFVDDPVAPKSPYELDDYTYDDGLGGFRRKEAPEPAAGD
jgi:cytochrome c oxidase subunit 1